ncbi:universal stress protein [Microbulbifer hydrolyticus]|uniref:Nucleotide-binding universal stress UspA family protein n=1 Tax=Microbulbifer hydrolyticus TaxID=48074 RepID=A0A6P1T871_9GAMM|nr:universal stress protein [Microbulbifer hydrolyticus]MBB5211324.1 nucleotide-binding universal stress UspA family protein [Microbulbifer hydrolyticus]QHQ37915.1 universal stress protein [Microbulbifer hydrolyticus]
MQSILVILDKPKHEQIALQRALELADKTGAKLHLVSFVYEPVVAIPLLSGSILNVSDQIQKERRQWLQELQSEYTLPQGSSAEVVWHHDIPSWTLAYLDANQCDLVVKTAQKQFGRGGFGSIDWRLIEHLPTPLWLAVSTHWIKRDRIVAALDPAVENKLHVELNQRALKLGERFSHELNADLEAVACVPASDEIKDLEKFREQAGALLQAVDKVIADSGVTCKKTHFVTGKPAAEVNRVVDRNKARMILVGRGVRKGPKGFLLGNTAERILGRANTDILVVP